MKTLMKRKPALKIINGYLKKTKVRNEDEECYCEIPDVHYICNAAPRKRSNSHIMVTVMVLAIYCVSLAFVLKSRITATGVRTGIMQRFSRLSKKSLENSEMEQRETPEIFSSTAVTTMETTSAPVVKHFKLAELREVSSNRFIASINPPVLRKKSMTAFGTWMKDPASSHDVVYVMDYYYRNTHVLAYNSTEAFVNDGIPEVHVLPVQWGGTGHAVYKGHLFFNRYNSSTLCKYSFEQQEIVLSRNLPQAGYGNMSPYQWAGSTDIDFSVDTDGLWVIYATPESQWNITISKLNEKTLQVEKTWFTSFRKKSAANAFIANGVLYTLHRYDSPKTMLNYAFDTATSHYFWPKIPFEIKFGSVASLDYDYRERRLYGWDRGHQVTYDVTFK